MVASADQGQWPPRSDELMALAESAEKLKRWPGGEIWLVDAADKAQIRRVAKDFVEASVKGDVVEASQPCSPGKSSEGLRSLMTVLKRMVVGAARPRTLNSSLSAAKKPWPSVTSSPRRIAHGR